ncbi:MAG: DUF4136 domain-containing protein [Lautropia sp.]
MDDGWSAMGLRRGVMSPECGAMGLGRSGMAAIDDIGGAGERRGQQWRWARAWRVAALVAAAAAMLGLGGCAAYLNAQVTAFHQADRDLAGRRFVIEPSAEQRDSLEFKAYADQVRQALVARGLVDAAGGAADTSVTLRYSIDDGRSVAYSYPGYGYMPFGPSMTLTPYRGRDGVVRYGWAPVYPMAYYGMVGSQYVQAVIYRRELRVELNERGAGGTAGGTAGTAGTRLYEGTAVSEGESASLAPVMPALITALFADFPGPNGASRIVRVQLPPAAERR